MVTVSPNPTNHQEFFGTELGSIYLGDAAETLTERISDASVDLIVTSPPFGLVRKKDYGNVDAGEYVGWFKRFGHEFYRVLKDTGSLAIDIGGSWIVGQPTRSLYHYELLIMLCHECGFHLAQEFFWWNPAKLPAPAEWVTVRRIRVKDAVNCVWWLSKTAWPKASNRRVPWPYSESMLALLKNGYRPKLRPSGHDISRHFGVDNGSSIPPNLLIISNTDSNSHYLRYCKENGIPVHPARFPRYLPEFFIRMTTDPGDLVIDPFAGSCVTGEVCEELKRKWICIDTAVEYLEGAVSRFARPNDGSVEKSFRPMEYKASHPAAAWGSSDEPALPPDGGRLHRCRRRNEFSE